MKKCRKCNIEKDLKHFYKKKTCSDGYNTVCKECHKTYVKNNYAKNPESKLKRMKEYRQENKEYLKKYESDRSKTEKRKKLAKKYHKNRYSKRKSEILAKNRKWAKENPEKQYKRTKRWRQENKGLATSYTVKYKARKLNATLDGYDSEIKEIYKNCPIGHEVDHIMPLQGENLCGLHVPWNLQYLTISENRSKSNKIIGDK